MKFSPRRIWGLLAGLGILAAGVLLWARRSPRKTVSQIPLTQVQLGPVIARMHAQGTVKGVDSDRLMAPMIGGGGLNLIQVPADGTPVKAGQVVVRFDPTVQEYNLQQAESQLAQAKALLQSAQATAQAQLLTDQYSLVHARYNVARAKLNVEENPILPAIQAQENNLALTAARAALLQTRRNVASDEASNQAQVAIEKAAETTARVQIELARRNMARMTLRASTSGYVAVMTNPWGTFFFGPGTVIPEFQVGDPVRPGSTVAELPDLNHEQISVDINETQAGSVSIGQPARITIAAFPGWIFHGQISQVGGVQGPPWARQTTCLVSLPPTRAQLRPGMSARLVITTGALQHTAWLPTQAVFTQGKRSYVYVPQNGKFVEHNVRIRLRGETQVAIAGLAPGQSVALVNPTVRKPQRAAKLPQTGPSLPGRHGRR